MGAMQQLLLRYIPRWLIEVGIVVAAVQIYRQSAGVRDKALAHPFVVRAQSKLHCHSIRILVPRPVSSGQHPQRTALSVLRTGPYPLP